MHLENVLFSPARILPPEVLARAVASHGGPLPTRKASAHATGVQKLGPFVADVLLVLSGIGSWGQPIVPKTLPKVLEWAQNAGLVGAGNQITERGLLLRSLFPESAGLFAKGDPLAWNPFILSPTERAFFLYHLGENDEALWLVAAAVGEFDVVDTAQAHKLTARALRDVVTRAEKAAPLHERPRLLRLRELTAKISHEVEPETYPAPRQSGPPPARKIQQQSEDRQTTKSADHEAIPRFEVLVDIGLLHKASTPSSPDRSSAMKAWKFVVRPEAHRLRDALRDLGVSPIGDWHWSAFARVVAASRLVNPSAPRVANTVEAMQMFGESYRTMHRVAGHTPFDSIAIRTVLSALEKGTIVEIAHLHDVLLHAKRTGALDRAISFAGSNEIGKMFVLVRPEFSDRASAWLAAAGFAHALADRRLPLKQP